MRRVKSTQLVTGRLYRSTGGVTLVVAFLVAMFAADGDDRAGSPASAPQLAASADPKPRSRAAAAYSPSGGLAPDEGSRDPDGPSMWPERSGALAYLGTGQFDPGQLVDQSDSALNLAPPPGYARDPHADRPTPQQLERLIQQSYLRSGSDGGGD